MRFILMAVLAAFITAAGAQAADAPKTPASDAAVPAVHALKIGYVDISRVWNDYRRRRDFESEYKTLGQDLTNQNRTRSEEIARYQREIEKLAMGTPERLALEEKAKTAMNETEDFRRKSVQQLDEKYISMLNRLLGEVYNEVATIAKEGDYDLILKEQSPDLSVPDRIEAVQQINRRVVLYAKPEYDLTSAVIKRLNDKYDAEQKKKVAAPESPKQPETPAKEK